MMKNKATLKFKNFTARARSFWVHLQFAKAGAAFCCARPAEVACLERSSTVAKPSGVGKNLKNQNFKSRNVTDADCGADHGIRLSLGRDINPHPDCAVNFKISNANLKADLARPKADFR